MSEKIDYHCGDCGYLVSLCHCRPLDSVQYNSSQYESALENWLSAPPGTKLPDSLRESKGRS